MTKKALAALTCACLTLALLPAAALAQAGDELAAITADDVVDSGTCGDDLTWTLTGTEEAGYTLTISGTGDMWDFPGAPLYGCSVTTLSNAPEDQYYPPWFSYRERIDTVTIDTGVTSIGQFAFMNCLSLRQVSIPDTVISTGYCSFQSCESLLTVCIPDGMEIIGTATFINCTALEEVQLGRNVEVIGYNAFDNCSALTSITIPVSLKSVDWMAFDECDALTDVYYAGTKEQWAAIDVAAGNDSLLNATIHYNWVAESPDPGDENPPDPGDGNPDAGNPEGSNPDPKAAPTHNPTAASAAAQSIRLAKRKVSVTPGKRTAVKVKGAKTRLSVKVPKKARKALTVKVRGKKKLVVRAKASAKSGTYKVKVWAKKGAGYAKSAKKVLKVKVA
ncbi:MAG: leucine-rich repeat protein [Bacteroidales bacterium]|nr:leucine-rich repeat protein [Bacteroidales bacterium]